MSKLTELERDILAVCAGEIRRLPYNKEQSVAQRRLSDLGLISCGLEDDQPTCWITDAGRAALKETDNARS